jgi:hypothetical protein
MHLINSDRIAGELPVVAAVFELWQSLCIAHGGVSLRPDSAGDTIVWRTLGRSDMQALSPGHIVPG